MADRIYLVTQNNTQRLIRANNQAAARSHAARSTITVKVASVDESIELTAKGIKVEDSTANPDQLLLPEIVEAELEAGSATETLDAARWTQTV